MSKKLAGTLFVYEGNKFDYNFKEAISSLLEFCDIVIVVAGGEDSTYEDVYSMITNNLRLYLLNITKEQWQSEHGKEKLSFFTNRAIKLAEEHGYEYQFNLQADECVHPDSYKAIRTVIESGCEGYMCKRINLWGSPNTQLIVPTSRMPCSTGIVRLAKTKYRSWDDAENIRVDDVNESYTDLIEIWHYGFVRDRKIMKQKVLNMQENVFGMNHDPKLDDGDVFVPERWFGAQDLKEITKPHPKLMSEWIKTRP